MSLRMNEPPRSRVMRLLRWILGPLLVVMGLFIIVLLRPPEEVQAEEHVIYLLPAGFLGAVIVLYNRADGTPPLYEGKARLYRIPPSGILRTRFSPWGGGEA